MKKETLVATAVNHQGRVLETIKGGPGATVRSMIGRIDAKHPNSYSATVRGEYTSDGTYWGLGQGRVLASRAPRMIDGTFYAGWIVE